ncbi:MAG: sodium-dependent transporter [Eubacteriales bacterium]|nr:sodium-dependent transporter [Eubacteriales bacterium]
MEREKFSTRVGFVFTAVGCAIGLGNIWRFPYITGKYGGAAFILIYLVFLVVLGFPLITMELTVGRASQKSITRSFDVLEAPGQKWHLIKYPAFAGNYLFQMFYTTVAGWVLLFAVKMVNGEFQGKNTAQIRTVYTEMLDQPVTMMITTGLIVVAAFLICAGGIRNGIERFCTIITGSLFALMIGVAFYVMTLDGAGAGISFYLKPDFGRLFANGIWEPVNAAMTQAFYTLGIGMGSIGVFGSFIGKERSLVSEAFWIVALDTVAALLAGMIIFPACFSCGIQPDSGPDLVFVTLPSVFASMPGGRVIGSFFLIAVFFAAFSTVITAFANIVSMVVDLTGCTARKSVAGNIVCMLILSMPCILGYNVWKGVQPFGAGSTIMDFEDFLVTNNILPLGSLIYAAFCISKKGWGWDNFVKEANQGKGLRFPERMFKILRYLIPIVIGISFLSGYISKFFIN